MQEYERVYNYIKIGKLDKTINLCYSKRIIGGKVMPYIKQEDRGVRAQMNPETLGELNYAITKLILWYLNRDMRLLTYSQIAMVTGVLENVKQEFYRRVAAPYEDIQIKENGDIY